MTNKLGEVSFLKGLAIICVILVHSPQKIPNINYFIEQLMRLGRWGCQLFYVLSGYLLYLGYRNNNDWRTYYKKRIVSLYPQWIIAILIYSAYFYISSVNRWGLFYEFRMDPKSILINIFMLNGLDPYSFNYVVPGGWYVGTQWLLYLLFPVLIYIFAIFGQSGGAKKLSINRGIITILTVGVLWTQISIRMVTKNPDITKLGSFVHYSILNQLPCFLIGIYLGMVYTQKGFDEYSDRVILCRFVILYFVATFVFYIGKLIPCAYVFVPTAYGISFYYLIILVFLKFDTIKNYRCIKICQKFGDYSYEVYYVNFIFTMMIPCALVTKFKWINGTFWYLVLLIPMIVMTFLGGKAYFLVLNPIKNVLRTQCELSRNN